MRRAAILALSLFFLSFGSTDVKIEERKGIHFTPDHASPFIHSTDDIPPNAVLLGVIQRRASRSKAPGEAVPGFGTSVALSLRPESRNKDPLFPHLSQQDLFQRFGVYRL